MNKEKLMTDIFKGLLTAMVIALALPDAAFAQAVTGGVDLGAAASNIMTNDVGPIAPLVSALFWVAGGVMMGAGALKLKEHAENPGQTPMRQGISRMAVGAALLTIPFFSQFVVNTMSNTSASAGYTSFVSP